MVGYIPQLDKALYLQGFEIDGPDSGRSYTRGKLSLLARPDVGGAIMRFNGDTTSKRYVESDIIVTLDKTPIDGLNIGSCLTDFQLLRRKMNGKIMEDYAVIMDYPRIMLNGHVQFGLGLLHEEDADPEKVAAAIVRVGITLQSMMQQYVQRD